MPTSKKPRKKSSGASRTSELKSLPNTAALEDLARRVDMHPDDEALSEAQFLMYDAWETSDGRSRTALARRALKLSPFCADAWLILAERSTLSATDRREYLERAVKAGALALGKNGFQEYEGSFWGFLETRPYMRARHSLAEDLWQAGDSEAAIGHLREMLALNPGDNQGLRYVLLSWLLATRDDAAVEKLLREHDDEVSAFMCYTQALFAFRKSGDSEVARKAVAVAWECNSHVPALMARRGRIRVEDTGYYTLGGQDEAAYYLEEYGFAWKETPGAVDWLVEGTKDLKPRHRGRIPDMTLH